MRVCIFFLFVCCTLSVSARPHYAARNAFRVNQETNGYQSLSCVVRNGGGDTLVVWTDERSGDKDIYARLLGINGTPRTAEFRVNQTTGDDQRSHDAAMDADGNIVVVWADYNLPRSIKARLYNSAGAALTGEFSVNTNVSGTVEYPAVDMSTNGYFIVTWSRADFGNSYFDLYYRLFEPNGWTTQSEKPVTVSDGYQRIQSDVAMVSTSFFMITWNEQVTPMLDPLNVYARVYNGPWPAAPFKVNQMDNSTDDSPPRIANRTDGQYCIVWGSKTNAGQNIRARRYNETTAITDEFAVDVASDGTMKAPDVAMNGMGNSVVTWTWKRTCCPTDYVYAKRFALDGSAVGGRFKVGQILPGSTYEPAVGLDNASGMALSWSQLDGNALGIYARVLEKSPDVVNDFDGDLLSDPALFWADKGTWYVQGSRMGDTNSVLGNLNSIPVSDDYDGDWLADYAIFDRPTGNWEFRFSSGGASMFNWGWDVIPVHADYDGDRDPDIAVYNPADGMWYILYASGATETKQFGWSGAVPVPGYYDEDNKADIAVYDPSVGNWYIQMSADDSLVVKNFGWAESLPIPADYDGDEVTDVAVYYPADGTWYIDQSTEGLRIQNWGWTAAWPVPGDYDGDGKHDLCVYHASAGNWYIMFADGRSTSFSFGWADALPVYQQFQINQRFGLVPFL